MLMEARFGKGGEAAPRKIEVSASVSNDSRSETPNRVILWRMMGSLNSSTTPYVLRTCADIDLIIDRFQNALGHTGSH